MDWLAFSLSNQQQPCFLDSFHPSSHSGGVSEQAEEEAPTSADLTMLTGPKLENFLGGRGEPMGRYSGADNGDCGGVYNVSDLKNITSGFLRGYPSDAPEFDSSKAVAMAVAEPKKAVDTFGQRTSIYRGVTRHRWTGRYEAHLWDNSCRREGQSRKGRQVYLGGYDKEEKAARAYDLAALKYWGPTTTTNFPVSNYEKELEEMKNMTRQEFVASLRRKSSGFSRGASIYRGVTRHHQHGRWQARIGRVAGNKDLYLGTFSTQEEAAEAYDIAAIKFRGLNAVTNFDMSRYDVKSIANSNLPIGGMSGRTSKTTTSESPSSSSDTKSTNFDLDLTNTTPPFGFAMPMRNQQQHDYWSMLALHQHQQQQQQQSQHNINNPCFNVNVFPSSVNVDFSTANTTTITTTTTTNQDGSYMWNNTNDMYMHQQQELDQQDQSHSSSNIPYATPIALGNGGYEANTTSYGTSWVTPAPSPMHTYPQTGKPNMGLYQTPVFGME